MTAAFEPHRDDTAGAHCWCGGEVGPRVPGDKDGNGCLRDVMHDWRGVARRLADDRAASVASGYLLASQHRSAAQLLAHTAGDALAALYEFLDVTGGQLTDHKRDQLALIRTSLELAQVHATLAGEPR